MLTTLNWPMVEPVLTIAPAMTTVPTSMETSGARIAAGWTRVPSRPLAAENALGNVAPSGVRPNTNHELMAVDVSQECAPNGSENDATSLLGCRVVVQESDYILASRPGNIGHDTTMAATPDDDEGVVIQEHPSRTP